MQHNNTDFKKRHFCKLHEKIHNKYMEMQRRLEKSKSVDSLATINDDYVFVDTRYASNNDISEGEVLMTENVPNSVQHSAIIEEVHVNDAHLQYISVREVSVTESEPTPIRYNENDNGSITSNFFGDDFSRMSLESLNEVAKESDEYQPSPSPPPTNSIRDKIGSRISAVKDKRRQREKERNATKDVKKESREKVEKFVLSNTKRDFPKSFKRAKMATVTIALIEATGLETDILDEKTSRSLYCRFRLGPDKFRSKSKPIKNNVSEVKWQELFNFNLIEDNIVEISLWDKDFCMGRHLIDLFKIKKEKTHKMRINMVSEVGSSTGQIFILLTISGISLANTLVELDDYKETQRQLVSAKEKFAWYHFQDKSANLGSLSVIVYGAKGLSSHDCYCIIELNNERLLTDTEFKTNEPNWMKIFTFDVTDVTSILDITIHDERKSEDIGKISIPLLRIKSEEKKWYALKDVNLRDRARGNNPRILVEMKLTWNLVKAAVQVIHPEEVSYLKIEDKVDRHIFARNLSRAKVVLNWILDTFKVFKSFLEWDSRGVNFVSLILWLQFCWFFKIWMLPLLLLIPFVRYRPTPDSISSWGRAEPLTPHGQEEAKKDEKNQTIRQKIQSLTDMVQTVQNFIGAFANLGESIKNLFNFTVPFLSCIAIFLITVVAFVMFMIPTRYIFMIWGIHKFTRKILRPNRIPNNEVLDLLSRVPNDEILLNCEEMNLEEMVDNDETK